ncbi:MAG: hypothetical protein EOO60_00155 [Hymenobacter sp.]|nr:MAG: hypothetical protein EOO60_00155 [Hymenobacter sp.]
MATESARHAGEGRHEEFDEVDLVTGPNDQSDFEAEASEPRCAHCGDLLAGISNPVQQPLPS